MNFPPKEFQDHQHAPMVTPERTILLFDNGTYRASPFTGEDPMEPAESYSRAVEYAIDEERMEVRQVWAYGEREDERFHSTFVSDADWLPETGNVLVTDGGKIYDAEGRPTSRPGIHRFARIVEVTHTNPAEEVFELVVRGEPPDGWHVYRADRIPSLYGGAAPR